MFMIKLKYIYIYPFLKHQFHLELIPMLRSRLHKISEMHVIMSYISIELQVELVKITLNVATENLNTELERFSAKWDQIKPRPDSGHITGDSLKELSTHWENVKNKRNQLDQLTEQKDKIMYVKTGRYWWRKVMLPPILCL